MAATAAEAGVPLQIDAPADWFRLAFGAAVVAVIVWVVVFGRVGSVVMSEADASAAQAAEQDSVWSRQLAYAWLAHQPQATLLGAARGWG